MIDGKLAISSTTLSRSSSHQPLSTQLCVSVSRESFRSNNASTNTTLRDRDGIEYKHTEVTMRMLANRLDALYAACHAYQGGRQDEATKAN